MSIDKDFHWIPYQENELIYEEIVVNKIVAEIYLWNNEKWMKSASLFR